MQAHTMALTPVIDRIFHCINRWNQTTTFVEKEKCSLGSEQNSSNVKLLKIHARHVGGLRLGISW
jgi:hypothetical protein